MSRPSTVPSSFVELRQNLAHLEAVLHPWPEIRVAGVSMYPGLMRSWEEWGGARGSIDLRRDHHPEQLELLGWLLSDGGKLERPYRENDPHDGWHVLWRGWRFYTELPTSIVPKPTSPSHPRFHDFPDCPGQHACRRPGCSAGSRMPSARTPCPLPLHLAEVLDQREANPRPGRVA